MAMILPRKTAASAAHVADLKKAQSMLRDLVAEKNCMPLLVRLAWHDAGTYNQDAANAGAWPAGNGAIGTIRFDKEITAGPNAGLDKAVRFLTPIKEVRTHAQRSVQHSISAVARPTECVGSFGRG